MPCSGLHFAVSSWVSFYLPLALEQLVTRTRVIKMKKRVLFVCIHNSARSQMAQELLNRKCGEQYEAQSAGLEPGALNPLAIQVLTEIGRDIAGRKTQSVADVLASGEHFDYVIAVCDGASAERCPVFPGVTQQHWSFPDPSQFAGTWEERLAQTRGVRELIASKIDEFCEANCLVAAI